jgi:hypothetical protein
MNINNKELGEPDIHLAELTIWIHGRQFPDATDYWDANWLNVTVHCGGKASTVMISGNLIHLSEITQLLSGIKKLHKNLKGKAEMQCTEPNLSVELEAEKLGHIKMTVNITPDYLYEKHTYLFEIDQSYLTKFISECESVLEEYPILGKP